MGAAGRRAGGGRGGGAEPARAAAEGGGGGAGEEGTSGGGAGRAGPPRPRPLLPALKGAGRGRPGALRAEAGLGASRGSVFSPESRDSPEEKREKRQGTAPATQRQILRDAEIEKLKKRETKRHRDRQRWGETQRHKEVKRQPKDGETKRQRKAERGRNVGKERHIQRDRVRETETQRATGTDKPTYGDRGRDRDAETREENGDRTDREALRGKNHAGSAVHILPPSPPLPSPGSSGDRGLRMLGGWCMGGATEEGSPTSLAMLPPTSQKTPDPKVVGCSLLSSAPQLGSQVSLCPAL